MQPPPAGETLKTSCWSSFTICCNDTTCWCTLYGAYVRGVLCLFLGAITPWHFHRPQPHCRLQGYRVHTDMSRHTEAACRELWHHCRVPVCTSVTRGRAGLPCLGGLCTNQHQNSQSEKHRHRHGPRAHQRTKGQLGSRSVSAPTATVHGMAIRYRVLNDSDTDTWRQVHTQLATTYGVSWQPGDGRRRRALRW